MPEAYNGDGTAFDWAVQNREGNEQIPTSFWCLD